ncbi:MAG: hypothetical protein LUF26_04460 [Firmicutes bacterium]|nr:hypothetical protein [Bacillota bacterium]
MLKKFISSFIAVAVFVLSLTAFADGGDMGGGDSGSDSSSVEQGDYAYLISTDGTYEGETYTSSGDNENALRVDGATVTLDNITVNKSGGATENAETSDFYGMNAALLATNGATVTITNSTVTSAAQGGNGIFSYGTGTTVTVSDTQITTTADNSGGIQTTGGGTTYAYDLTISTSGSSAAAIRSDRGGGTVVVDGGTYTSNGYNSPAIYSTADITVSDAELTANNSEALVVEGANSINLTDCIVSGNMDDEMGSSSDENVHNVMIYQSQSGDAATGTSYFTMTGGTLTSNNGDVFYVTNTDAVISLSGVTIVNNDDEGALFTISGNSASHNWGTAGENGATVTLTIDNTELEGDINVDTVSTLDLSLTGGTEFTGTVNIFENADGGTAVDDNAVVTIDEDSTWTLTGNCVITSLTNNGTINYNGYTITLADGTELSGDSDDSGSSTEDGNTDGDTDGSDTATEITDVSVTESTDGLTVTVEAQNPENGIIIAAGYADGVLIDIAEAEDGTALLSQDCEKVKVFIWDSLDGMNPLCTAYTSE